jgi:hypothetical protein
MQQSPRQWLDAWSACPPRRYLNPVPASVRLARVKARAEHVRTLNLEPVLRGELLAEMAAVLDHGRGSP